MIDARYLTEIGHPLPRTEARALKDGACIEKHALALGSIEETVSMRHSRKENPMSNQTQVTPGMAILL